MSRRRSDRRPRWPRTRRAARRRARARTAWRRRPVGDAPQLVADALGVPDHARERCGDLGRAVSVRSWARPSRMMSATSRFCALSCSSSSMRRRSSLPAWRCGTGRDELARLARWLADDRGQAQCRECRDRDVELKVERAVRGRVLHEGPQLVRRRPDRDRTATATASVAPADRTQRRPDQRREDEVGQRLAAETASTLSAITAAIMSAPSAARGAATRAPAAAPTPARAAARPARRRGRRATSCARRRSSRMR